MGWGLSLPGGRRADHLGETGSELGASGARRGMLFTPGGGSDTAEEYGDRLVYILDCELRAPPQVFSVPPSLPSLLPSSSRSCFTSCLPWPHRQLSWQLHPRAAAPGMDS